MTVQANTEGRVKVVAIDNAAYRAINRTDTLGASGHLRRLRDLALLEMKGAGRCTPAGGDPSRHTAGKDSRHRHQA